MRSKGSQVLLLFVGAILLSGVGFGGNCPVTTLDAYLGSGYSCGINDTTYSNFMYTGTSNPPGFAMPAGSIGVTPITTSGNPGFQFSAGWFASTGSGILEQDSLIQYMVNVNQGGSPITDLSLSIGGLGWTGTGTITVDETACLGAMLPTCSGGQIINLSVFDSSSGSQLYSSAAFAGVTEIDLEKDIEVVAGSNGSASLSVVTNQFSQSGSTPEPGTLSMLGAGVLCAAGFVRRKLGF